MQSAQEEQKFDDFGIPQFKVTKKKFNNKQRYVPNIQNTYLNTGIPSWSSLNMVDID